jgi:hypothetical protein
MNFFRELVSLTRVVLHLSCFVTHELTIKNIESNVCNQVQVKMLYQK